MTNKSKKISIKRFKITTKRDSMASGTQCDNQKLTTKREKMTHKFKRRSCITIEQCTRVLNPAD